MNSSSRRLEELTTILLDTRSAPGELREATQALYHHLFELSPWLSTESELEREIQLPTGVAISPRDAARCILDFARTAGFLRGVDRAVREMRVKHPDRPVDLLYAGCGPLAPLVLPVAARYAADALRVTLLEINPGALDSARRMFEGLGLSDRIEKLVLVDAAEFSPVPNRRWDIVVVEILQRALEKEPQLAVTAQLGSQLADDGILVPERISVSLALADLSKEFALRPAENEEATSPPPERDRIELGTLMELDRDSAPGLLASAVAEPRSGEAVIPGARIQIPDSIDPDRYTAVLRTTIQIGPSIELGDYASGLTMPRPLDAVGHVAPGDVIEFCYRTGECPGFEFKRVQ